MKTKNVNINIFVNTLPPEKSEDKKKVSISFTANEILGIVSSEAFIREKLAPQINKAIQDGIINFEK